MKKKTILLLYIFEEEIGIFLLLIKNILKNIRSSAFLSNCQKFKKNWTNCCRFDVIYYELMSLKKMSFSLKITFSKCMQTALFLHSKTWTKNISLYVGQASRKRTHRNLLMFLLSSFTSIFNAESILSLGFLIYQIS